MLFVFSERVVPLHSRRDFFTLSPPSKSNPSRKFHSVMSLILNSPATHSRRPIKKGGLYAPQGKVPNFPDGDVNPASAARAAAAELVSPSHAEQAPSAVAAAASCDISAP